MAITQTLLIVDDNKNILKALELLLKDHFTNIITLNSPNQLLSTLTKEKVDVILLDMNFSTGINNGNEGLFWMNEIKKRNPSIPIILITAYADIDLAVKGIKEGATDFISKPWDNRKLIHTLQNAVSTNKKKRNSRVYTDSHNMYWGESNSMKEIRALVEKVALTNATILITGENGTGKEVIAREIHSLSDRFISPMTNVDMGALPESLFESELFGHMKGSFTDAHTDRIGKFEVADKSTLFLDEIGNLSYPLQAKLLTAIQNREITRIGSNTPIPVDIRLICATNKNLFVMIEDGSFREDLLYRINTIHIELPPLRERKEDIIPLAEQFLSKFSEQYNKPVKSLSSQAKEKLLKHSWPGNIRELQHAMEKAVILCDTSLLPRELLDMTERKNSYINTVSSLEEMELVMIRKAIESNNGNLTNAASQLGVTRQTLYNKMKKFGL